MGARLKGLKGLKIKPFSHFLLIFSELCREAEGLKDFFDLKNTYIGNERGYLELHRSLALKFMNAL